MVPFVGKVTQWKLLKYFGSAKSVYDGLAEEYGCLTFLNKRQVKSLIDSKDMADVLTLLAKCNSKGISILTADSGAYPSRFIIEGISPLVLYSLGNIDYERLKQTVGIVGARRCSQENKLEAAAIAERYVAEGCTIVSGMAKGIDSYAHTACIKRGGYTVAVLGNGVDICYPREHNSLLKKISETGLVISEYTPGSTPKQYHFPERNKIIAAWSDRLEVVAAGKGSGALITLKEWQKKKYAYKVSRTIDMT